MDELALVRWIGEHRVAAVDWAAWVFGLAGRFGGLWIAVTLVGLALRRVKPAGAWQVTLALILAFVAADFVVKPLVDRNRPYELDSSISVVGAPPASSSFPSGHTATAFAAAVALSCAWPGGAVAWWLLASLVALSRVYLGVHFPTDVLGGVAVGYACGRVVVGRTSWYSLGSISRTSGVAR